VEDEAMTLAKNKAPRRERAGRPPVRTEEAYSERLVVMLRPHEMAAVRAFMAKQSVPAGTYLRQMLLARINEGGGTLAEGGA
jgi:hypothetical protein